MTARLMMLNGPNLNLLGVREPHIYGSTTLASIKASCEKFAKSAGAHLSFHQSNHEGVLVDFIQAAREQADTIIINPADIRSHLLRCSTRSRRLKDRLSRCISPISTRATNYIDIQNCHLPRRRSSAV